MSNAAIPASALSRYYNTFQPSLLRIGAEWVKASLYQKYDDPWYWFVVVSLEDLSIVANECSTSATDVPQSIAAYQGKTGYFLFFIANAARGYTIPQGTLYTFIRNVGGGRQLERLEQSIEQLGTGTITFFSYVLAATTDTEDLPGFEMSSQNHYSVLNMQFKPIEDEQGQPLGYAPVQV